MGCLRCSEGMRAVAWQVPCFLVWFEQNTLKGNHLMESDFHHWLGKVTHGHPPYQLGQDRHCFPAHEPRPWVPIPRAEVLGLTWLARRVKQREACEAAGFGMRETYPLVLTQSQMATILCCSSPKGPQSLTAAFPKWHTNGEGACLGGFCGLKRTLALLL